MCCQEKLGGISGKYFFNPFPVSLKILLKFFKMNYRYHIDMSFHSIHENHYKKARVNFQCDHEAEVNMSRKICILQPSVEMETMNKFHSLNFNIFQQGNEISASRKAPSKISTKKILRYNISNSKQIIITLFLVATQRNFEKKLS